MLRDVFYYGAKPNVHPREKYAKDFDDAKSQCTTEHFWIINEFCDYRGFDWDFDFEFLPDEDVWAQAHVNIWPSQHQKDSGTWLCHRECADIKIYRADVDPIKRKNEINQHWIVPENCDTSKFDFSWHPDPTSPPYIYQYGTLFNDCDGPKYVTPNNTGEVVHKLRTDIKPYSTIEKYTITTTLEDLVNEHPNEVFWALNPDIDYSNFDFTWRPNIDQVRYVHAFGSSDNINTQTYFVSGPMWHQGYKDINYVGQRAEFNYLLDVFFIDRGNRESNERFEQLKVKFGNRIHKTRYLNSWVDTINRCVTKSQSKLFWVLNSELDYTGFDFDYYPNPWQMKMVHVFGTQWGHWGTTFMVNTDSFTTDTKYVKIIEHLSNLNFVRNRRAKATSCLYDVFVIDFGNNELDKVVDVLQPKVTGKTITNVEYKGNYFDTFKQVLNQVTEQKEHYIWICSSICDYTTFDFTYICDPFAKEQLHVFPSDNQKFGDTFLVNVNRFRELLSSMQTLQDYNKINFNQHMFASRYPAPEVISGDTHTEKFDIDNDFPYTVFRTSDNVDIQNVSYEPMIMWSEETKNIIVTSTGGTQVIVPKEAKEYVKRELYDYPYIVKSTKLSKSKPLDIVFLSNGEKCADENYEHLLNVTKGLPNKIVRVDGVNGRVAAYHAAAKASTTPWMFTVFAKLKVSNNFDWSWQPDRLQVPKHYVFYAKNPLNGLTYGHQAMIAYNKKMTLNNQGKGLDFTQDDEHEVLELNSGTAIFNIDEWTTWRTAFRECIKLCNYKDKISQERLNTWTTVAKGDFAQYCLDGANDAVSYFNEVAGDFDLLKLSYDWAWLHEKFKTRYK